VSSPTKIDKMCLEIKNKQLKIEYKNISSQGIVIRYLNDSLNMQSDNVPNSNNYFELSSNKVKTWSTKKIEILKEFNFKEMKYKEREESQFNLNDILLKISNKINDSMLIKKIEQISCTMNKSNQMILEYETFKSQNIKFLESLVTNYEYSGPYKKLIEFILKFLLDMQTETDLNYLSSKELYFLEYFLVNRYFKHLKNKIIDQIHKNNKFKNFIIKWGFNVDNESDPNFFANINLGSYQESIIHWAQFDEDPNHQGSFFNTYISKKIFKYFDTPHKNQLLNGFMFIFNRIIQMQILKFLVSRFKNTQLIFDEVECIESDILQIMFIVIDSFTILGEQIKLIQDKTKRVIIIKSFIFKVMKLFKFESNSSILTFTKYIKFREMREYVERKKKSKFIRHRRNDEKIKKVYKHIMMKMYSDFKEQEMDFSPDVSLDISSKKKCQPSMESFENKKMPLIGKRLFKFKDKFTMNKVFV
jgi:hypothetical protein